MNKLPKFGIRHVLLFFLLAQFTIGILLILSDLRDDILEHYWLNPNEDYDSSIPDEQRRPYSPRLWRDDQEFYINPDTQFPIDSSDRLTFNTYEDMDLGMVLLLEGSISLGDASRFRSYLATQDELEVPVALHSNGGLVEEALEIGRIIREINADVVILEGMICLSSCPYALAGGVSRKVSKDSWIGLHQHYYSRRIYIPTIWAVEDIQYGQGQVMQHLIDMGVNTDVMLYSLNTPMSEIYIMTESDLLESRMATEILNSQNTTPIQRTDVN